MKVLCNLHPLGIEKQTGVGRVVKELVWGLASSSECEIYFHAISNTWFSERYFNRHLAARHAFFITNPIRRLVARHLLPLESFVSSAFSGNQIFPIRLARGLAAKYTNFWNNCLTHIPGSTLAKIDIYHSPVLPIPRQIKRSSAITRFTTLYDLIAITHPEYFGKETIRMMQQIVHGFTEDDFVLCISHATRDVLLAHSKCDPAKVFVTYLAAGPFFYVDRNLKKAAAIKARLRIPNGRYFLTLSTVEVRKNLEIVIRAYGHLRRTGAIGSDVSLVMVGGMGWKTDRIDAALKEVAEFRDSIIVAGFVPDDNLSSLYSNAIAFVYMSRLEGFGLPPLEAMACGTPVITSNTSALPEVVGNAGIQLDPDDLEGLCSAMLSFTENEEKRMLFSNLSLEQSRKFSWDKFIAETIAAYQIALKARR